MLFLPRKVRWPLRTGRPPRGSARNWPLASLETRPSPGATVRTADVRYALPSPNAISPGRGLNHRTRAEYSGDKIRFGSGNPGPGVFDNANSLPLRTDWDCLERGAIFVLRGK